MDDYAEAIEELIEIASFKGKIAKSSFQKLSKEYELDAKILRNKFKLYKGVDWFEYTIKRSNSSSELKTVKAIAEARISQNSKFYRMDFKPSCGVHATNLDGEVYVYVGFRIDGRQDEKSFADDFHEIIIASTKKTIFVGWNYLHENAPKLVDKIYNFSKK